MADVRSGMDSETRGNTERVYVEIGPLWMYNDVAICGKNGIGRARLTLYVKRVAEKSKP